MAAVGRPRKRKTTNRTFGDRVRGIIDSRGWNVERLAKESGLSLGTVCKTVHGHRLNPSLETVKAIRRALGVSYAALIDGEE